MVGSSAIPLGGFQIVSVLVSPNSAGGLSGLHIKGSASAANQL